MKEVNYNPDVLECLANLSNDEVFTPPSVVNAMLDLLPTELWSDGTATFLDPACKTGVFLREIAKRLMYGLRHSIPDVQERANHIFTRQLYGIAITRLTALMSRRSLYCSKDADGHYSVCTAFKSDEGNVSYSSMPHTWGSNGRCTLCGASRQVYDRGDELENYAYNFIHSKDIPNMKFDVIIGNPPYQMSDGGGKGASATPIFQHFVSQAKKLNPKYMAMIIPARWFSGGKGLDSFRNEMLSDRHIIKLVDYFNAEECFPGIDLAGGICYFLWSRDEERDCDFRSNLNSKETHMKRPLLENGITDFIRFNDAVSIVRKVKLLQEKSFENMVSPRKPFGIEAKDEIYKTMASDRIKVYAYPDNGFIHNTSIRQNKEWTRLYKVFISKAYGERGSFPYLIIGRPFIGEPNSCCTETYLVAGCFDRKDFADNVISYMKTKFFRFLVLLKKNTQNASKGVYSFVPLQDFSKSWTDEELYAKYNLTDEEIAFIESMIRPME